MQIFRASWLTRIFYGAIPFFGMVVVLFADGPHPARARLVLSGFFALSEIYVLNILFERIAVTQTELVRTTFFNRTVISIQDIVAAECTNYARFPDTVLAIETRSGKVYWARSFATKRIRELAELINSSVKGEHARATSL